MDNFDEKDFQILLELDRNCRQSLVALKEKLRIPIETLRYRIQRLKESGVIKNFLTVIDGGHLGFYYYKVFFKLYNVNPSIIQKLSEELAAHPQICWVIAVDGNYDLAFTPRVSNPLEQSILLDSLRSKYSKYIRRWSLSVNIKMDFFSRDYLLGVKERPKALGSYSTKAEVVPLDQTAQQILQALARDPRQSAAAIGRDLNISSDTVLDRIESLEKNKIIVRYTIVTDPSVIKHHNFYVLVYFSHFDPQREKEFIQFCTREPNIVYLIKSLGDWDYELSVEAAKLAQYRELLMKISREFSDIVYECNAMFVSKIYKYVYP